MALAVVYSRALSGMDAPLVTVEVHLANGLPAFTIVGLPEAEVRESKDRVRSALQTAHFDFPARRITVNLAPADLPKESGRFDLPIAIGILAASGQLPCKTVAGYEFAGELALTGELRPVRGALAMAIGASGDGRAFVVPHASAAEAALLERAAVYPARSLLEVCAHLSGEAPLARQPAPDTPAGADYPDWDDVRGQLRAKRVLEVAAAGCHSLLMVGPPGTGKSMLASRLPAIMPPMTEEQALETARVASLSSAGFGLRQWRKRPFRAPHHTASAVALVGGGADPKPGEISLAHHGVLFLDELPEFDRRVLEVLREPIESGRVSVSRAARQVEYPARFQLVAAMNPCPCGYLGDGSGRCRCTPEQVQRYRGKLSGPLLDRIDLQVTVGAVPPAELMAQHVGDPVDTVRERVAEAYRRQLERQGRPNSQLSPREVELHCAPDAGAAGLLAKVADRFNLSTRAYHRVLKVARTIADIGGSGAVETAHVGEALQYRRFEMGPDAG